MLPNMTETILAKLSSKDTFYRLYFGFLALEVLNFWLKIFSGAAVTWFHLPSISGIPYWSWDTKSTSKIFSNCQTRNGAQNNNYITNNKVGCVFLMIVVSIHYRLYCLMWNSDEMTIGKTYPVSFHRFICDLVRFLENRLWISFPKIDLSQPRNTKTVDWTSFPEIGLCHHSWNWNLEEYLDDFPGFANKNYGFQKKN